MVNRLYFCRIDEERNASSVFILSNVLFSFGTSSAYSGRRSSVGFRPYLNFSWGFAFYLFHLLLLVLTGSSHHDSREERKQSLADPRISFHLHRAYTGAYAFLALLGCKPNSILAN